ncbi:MAG: nucleoside transporter C-terminal domain-containing protein [Mariniblastus sp.]|nr:nucleoside transporter C-terminal domain-containing protein [Mariniblastus sp.]
MSETVAGNGVSILNLVSLFGLLSMLGFAWLMSSHKTKVNWKLVAMGLGLQLVLATVLFQSQSWTFGGEFPDGILFAGVEFFFREITLYVESGAGFVFRANGIIEGNPTDPMTLVKTFAFGVLPTVIFFAALMSILYHIGVMTTIIRFMAWIMQKTLGTSGAESLAAAANVLVGHTEAPLVVRPYIETMTRSELNALMVGGFATITGSLMAVFVAQGISAGHILTACIISAPAALVIAKIMQPEMDEPETLGHVDAATEKTATNVIEAAAVGASDGVKLAINIAGMLIAFLALIALADALLIGFGNLVEYAINPLLGEGSKLDFEWSLNNLFAAAFYPLAMIMGIETTDCGLAGQLLGKKMVVNEFVAYLDLGAIINDMSENGAAAQQKISHRTEIILTYALAGFSNFGAIGIQLGGIGPLAPKRRSDLAQLGFRAMLGGMLACCMTACIAGMLYGLVQ